MKVEENIQHFNGVGGSGSTGKYALDCQGT